jgi:beta-glucosidase-like glycosyl hydrolase/CubicO group peptidase (beta-lactamase class C family)
MRFPAFFLIVFLCIFSLSSAQNPKTDVAQDSLGPLQTDNFRIQKIWVDSVYNSMNLDEKIGQLFMPMVFSSKGKAEQNAVERLIKKYHLGGVIFSKGNPVAQAKMTNSFQEKSDVPLMIAMDAEWGLAMRLDSTYAFPWNMTLGAVEDLDLIKKVGAQIAEHCKRLGVHINFAPDADINNNPKNPIIGNRSFGEDREEVAKRAIAFMRGMDSIGVLSSAKHFPGHGDTDVDSHKALPSLDFTKKRLDSLELYPFKKLINAGVSSVMIAHLNVPSLTAQSNLPTSLSKAIVTDLLKEKMGYKGLVFTDALNMQGVADHDKPGQTDLDAFKAGNDILLISESIPKAFKKIKAAYKEDEITEKRLAHSVKKFLEAKFKAGLNTYKPIQLKNLTADLNKPENDQLYGEVMEKAVTLAKNNEAVVPVENLGDKKIAYVHFGDASGEAFLDEMQNYAKVDNIKGDHLDKLITKLKPYNLVVIGLHRSNANPWKAYNFTDQELVWLQEISRQHKVVLNIFTRPYALLDLRSSTNLNGILIGYQNSEIAQQKTAQVLFGALPAQGKLPVSAGKQFPVGTQLKTRSNGSLAYGMPGDVGMARDNLAKIDSIAQVAIDGEMTPGLQILIARKGKVFYRKNFGFHTYKKKTPVQDDDIYDLASVTKILATLPLFMELYEEGVVDMNSSVGDILPGFKNSNKATITMKAMLSHYARLKAWIPFFLKTINEKAGKASAEYFHRKPDSLFKVHTAENLYMRKDYIDSMYQRIKESPLRDKLEYKYSDLPFYLLKKFIERHYKRSMNILAKNHFYKKLGAYKMGYLPLNFHPKSKIIPAEKDDYWRDQNVQGYVQDQGAAMLGGIGGHAGLFSNSNGVAKMMQMYLNGGSYGGTQYLKPSTINAFNTCYYFGDDVRRGVGFDKPQLDEIGPTCGCLSMKSFGHSGYTGILTWADPDEEIIYVFLSNRTFPNSANKKLIHEDIRTKIQKVIYNSIER